MPRVWSALDETKHWGSRVCVVFLGLGHCLFSPLLVFCLLGRLIEKFLERHCFMGVATDVQAMPNSDQFVKKVALDGQEPC
jgi:hypothetical protein